MAQNFVMMPTEQSNWPFVSVMAAIVKQMLDFHQFAYLRLAVVVKQIAVDIVYWWRTLDSLCYFHYLDEHFADSM